MANIVKPPCDEGVIHSAPLPSLTASVTPKRNVGRWVLAATILGSSMAFIDGTVVNVALPVLQRDLQTTVTDVQWIVEAYSLFLAALILVGGSLGDHYGRRRIFAIGVVLFTLASMWCGLSPNTTQLIIARAIQGIGGALLVPGSLAIISASFDAKQRGQAIGTWSGFTSITAALGPVLGLFYQHSSGNSRTYPAILGCAGESGRRSAQLVNITIPTGVSGEAHTALVHAIDESFVYGFRIVMLIAAGLLIEGKKANVEVAASANDSTAAKV